MAEPTEQVFEIQRVYVKDLSLESPSAPDLFREQWQPETHVDLNVAHTDIKDDNYEVVLRITVTMKNKEKSVLVIEVKQAAIFHIKGFEAEQMDHMLRAYCPTVLFPYAREAVAAMTTRATFPPVNLAPVNFDAVYVQQQQAAEEAAKKEKK